MDKDFKSSKNNNNKNISKIEEKSKSLDDYNDNNNEFNKLLSKIFKKEKTTDKIKENAFELLCLNIGDIKIKLKNGEKFKVHSEIFNITNDKKIDLSKYSIEVSANFLIAAYTRCYPKINSLENLHEDNTIEFLKLCSEYKFEDILDNVSNYIIDNDETIYVNPKLCLEKYKKILNYVSRAKKFFLCSIAHKIVTNKVCYNEIQKDNGTFSEEAAECCYGKSKNNIECHKMCCVHRNKLDDANEIITKKIVKKDLISKYIENLENIKLNRGDEIIMIKLLCIISRLEQKNELYNIHRNIHQTNIIKNMFTTFIDILDVSKRYDMNDVFKLKRIDMGHDRKN